MNTGLLVLVLRCTVRVGIGNIIPASDYFHVSLPTYEIIQAIFLDNFSIVGMLTLKEQDYL